MNVDTIFASAALEQPAFFSDGTDRALHVHLGFDSVGQDDAAAQTRFRAFLGALKDVRFYLYRIAPGAAATFDLTLVAGPLAALKPPPIDYTDPVATWIAKRAANWVSPPGDPAMDYLHPNARHLLDAAERWDAPYPQRAGLSRLLRDAGRAKYEEYLVLPIIGADPNIPPPWPPAGFTGVTLEGKQYLVNGAATPDFAGAVLSVSAIETPGVPSQVDTASGFLKTGADAEATALPALLQRIREMAGSRLATAPQLLDIVWLEPARPESWTGFKRLRWRALNGLLTLLDPAICALTMAGTPREGPIVVKLNVAIGEVLARPDIETIARAVTNWVTTSITGLFRADSTVAADRVVLVTRLARLFDLEAQLRISPPVPQSAGLEDISALLPLLLTLYVNDGVGDTAAQTWFGQQKSASYPGERWLDDLDRQLDRELAAAAARIEQGTGFEAVLLAMLAMAGVDAAELSRRHPELDAAAAAKVFDTFTARLRSGIDAAGLARTAEGQLFEAALAVAKTRAAANFDQLCQALRDADWFAGRLGLAPAGVFADLANALPVIDVPLEPADRAWLVGSGVLAARHASACVDLIGPSPVLVRVKPEHTPRALPVRIAIDHDPGDAEAFAAAYSGLSVLVQRDAEPWSYASFAAATVQRSNGAKELDLIVFPTQPVANDGHYLLYLNYQGDPLARRKHDPSESGSDDVETLIRFYSYDDPSPELLGNYPRLPGLGYGHRYTIAAHAVSRSGALPSAIALPGTPWMPALVLPDPDKAFQTVFDYRRTTAIGAISLGDASGEGEDAARFVPFHSDIADVTPLFRDYPSLGHQAPRGGSARFDLWRHADGGGTVPVPEDEQPVSVALDNLHVWPGVTSLSLDLFDMPLPDRAQPPRGPLSSLMLVLPAVPDHCALRLELAMTAPGLRIALHLDGPDGAQLQLSEKVVPMPTTPARLWGRMAIAAASDGGAISFANPDVQADKEGQTPKGAGFLLLAPDASSYWTGEVRPRAEAHLAFPRMQFFDFDRWLNSKALATEAAAGHDQILYDFRAALHDLYIAAEDKPLLMAMLGRMPDLAVTALQIDLLPVDRLDDTVGDSGATPPLRSVTLPIDRLGTLLFGLQGETDIQRKLARLDAALLRTIVIEAGPTLALDPSGLCATVPAGMVAQLRIRPLVPKRYFDGGATTPVFDDLVRHWSVDERTGDGLAEPCLLFDGPVLTIETMRAFEPKRTENHVPFWRAKADQMIKVVPAGNDRRYDIVVDNVDPGYFDWRWREIGSVEIATERWRFLGTPIDQWRAPKQFAVKDWCATQAVLPLTDHAEINAFEEEIFGSPDMDDAVSRAHDVAPWPAQTSLETFTWEEPSATMFRHRIAVRSRYRGAIRSARSAEMRVTEAGGLLGRAVRVAVLADRSRLQITRPQLRALMPLTAAPPTARGVPPLAPPVLAFVEERPFGHGGLAERIGGEIKTSFGYLFVKGHDAIELGDARREFGPDPRLSYTPTDADIARAVGLQLTGPIGLTFDPDIAPSFVNTALVLEPGFFGDTSLAPGSFEEHFLSVSLRRYLDHRWTIGEMDPAAVGTADANACWWIEPVKSQTAATLSCQAVSGVTLLLCIITTTGKNWEIRLGRQVIHAGDTQTEDVLAARVSKANGDIALLHQPLEEGRGSLSVFQCPAVGMPVMLCTIEWALPLIDITKPEDRQPKELVFDQPTMAYPCAASPGTAMNWTRTGIDADHLRLVVPATAWPSDGTPLERVAVSDLQILETPAQTALQPVPLQRSLVLGSSAVPRWARTASSVSPNPLYVHRHLALILTIKAGGLGRDLEVYGGAWLMPGSAIPAFVAKPGQTARIVELEVPALPIGSGNAVDPAYTSATFDLQALIPATKDSAGRALLFFLRPLGGVIAFNPVFSLKFMLDWPGSSSPLSISVLNSKAIDAVSLLLWLDADGLRGTAIDGLGRAVTLTVNYDHTHALPDGFEFETIEFSGFSRVQAGVTIDTEFWADISMLVSTRLPKPAPPSPTGSSGPATDFPSIPVFDASKITLEFGWFFGLGDATSALSPGPSVTTVAGANNAATAAAFTATGAEAVTSDALRTMTEAQARIVSMSPPIPVVQAADALSRRLI